MSAQPYSQVICFNTQSYQTFFSPSSSGALSGLTSTLLFQPCTSLPSCASCPSSRSATSRPHKDASSAGRCLTQDKVSSPRPHENQPDLTLCPVKPVPFAPPRGRSSLP